MKISNTSHPRSLQSISSDLDVLQHLMMSQRPEKLQRGDTGRWSNDPNFIKHLSARITSSRAEKKSRFVKVLMTITAPEGRNLPLRKGLIKQPLAKFFFHFDEGRIKPIVFTNKDVEDNTMSLALNHQSVSAFKAIQDFISCLRRTLERQTNSIFILYTRCFHFTSTVVPLFVTSPLQIKFLLLVIVNLPLTPLCTITHVQVLCTCDIRADHTSTDRI